MNHWFDGFAMLHRFSFANGEVSYANRFLESRAYRAARDQGKIAYSEFATDPCRSLFQRVSAMFSPKLTDNANINLTKLGERFISMTETPIPVEFDAETLATAGVPYKPPGQLSTAHPHMDRATKGMLNYAAKLGPRSSYRFFLLRPGSSKPELLATKPVREPAYMHSFGLTERWLVLAEFPFVVNPPRLAFSGRPYIENYRWKPELGTRFHLFDRATGKSRRPVRGRGALRLPSRQLLRGGRRGGGRHLHLLGPGDRRGPLSGEAPGRQADRSGASGALPHLARGGNGERRAADRRGHRAAADQLRQVQRAPLPLCVGRRAPRAAGSTGSSRPTWSSARSTTWSEEGCFPGEPVFVAAPDADGEDEGVLLSVVLDGRKGNSFLLVLDARSLDELARAEVPHHIPFGFHGQFARG